MQYVNFIFDGDDDRTLHTGPVPDSDAAYLRQAATHLRPLSDEDYMNGPAGILHTMAKYSYILDDRNLYWCIEWPPGLLVVRMASDKELQWVAFRSPVPNFGDRVPLPEDLEDGDPDEYCLDDNPQYNLIFTPWDAQYNEEEGFVPADIEVQARFENALARVNALAGIMETRYADDRDGWLDRCKQNLEKWCGEGVRLKSAS